MALVSAYSLALSSYPSPKQIFVQALVHYMHTMSRCDAPCCLFLQWSLLGLSVGELCMQQALCCLLLCVCFLCATSCDYNGMLLPPFKQFHIAAWLCWTQHCSLSSALHCITNHTMLIQTACRMYVYTSGRCIIHAAYLLRSFCWGKKAKFLLCKELFQTQTHTSKLKHIGRVILTHTLKEKLNKQRNINA